MTGIRWLWFALRITLANMLHVATVAFFAFLHAFKGFIFVIGGLGCIIMYYHLNKHFTAPDNYTIPFFVGFWVMACAGEAITSMLHYTMPFHRLLAVLVKKKKIATLTIKVPLTMSKPVKVTVAIFSFLLTFTSPLSASTSIQDVEVGFSPGRTAKQIVLMAIEEAQTSIDIAAYSFTSKPIALALVDAQQRGVNVRVVADKKSNGGKYTAVTYLMNHRVPVRLNDKYAIMHNKFMIVDNHSVETGSFNYTKSAVFRNAENVIYLRNRPDIAEKYTREFNRLWSEAIDTKLTY